MIAAHCHRVAFLAILSWSGVVSATIHGREDSADQLKDVEEDARRNVTELIRSKGYPCEDYNVVTEDGFILSLQRIPHGRHNVLVSSPRPVVFLQHGLLDSSATWVLNSAAQSLGFLLADAGFDVWLGNVRGNTYSRHHTKYHPKDHEFWAWSWDEMAKYDLPAMLKFALATTGQPDLFYIGHSQGTLIAFASFSQDAQLAKQVKAFVAFGPVLKLGHAHGAIRVLIDIAPDLQFLFKWFGVNEFLPSDPVLHFLASALCQGSISRYICENILFLVVGCDVRQMNASRLPVYVWHAPAGSSVQNMIHFSQIAKSNKFQMYDFGSEDLNRQHYNQPFPPAYNISAFSVPTYVYSGGHDLLSSPQDVKDTISLLHSIKAHREIPDWNHLDFLWGLDANKILYKEIIDVLRKTCKGLLCHKTSTA